MTRHESHMVSKAAVSDTEMERSQRTRRLSKSWKKSENKDKCLVKFRRPGIRQRPPWVINTIKPPAYYPGPRSLHYCCELLSTSFKTHIPLINTLCWVHMSRHRGLSVPLLTHLFISVIPSHFRCPSSFAALLSSPPPLNSSLKVEFELSGSGLVMANEGQEGRWLRTLW